MELMHIIHISTANSWRGGEQQLAHLMSELTRKGVSQEVLCIENAPLAAYCDQNGVATKVFKKQGALNLKAANMLANLCKQKRNIIVHCHDSHAHNIAYFSAIFFKNQSPVIVHRRVDFAVSNSFLSRAKYNHRTIAKLICVSNAIREILIPSLKNPEKAVVVHSGIDLSKFTGVENKNTLRKEFGFSDDTTLVGNIAALAPHKDYFTFIATAEILLKNNPQLRFVIIGEGSERKSIENEIQTRGLVDKILLAGFRTNIKELLKELNVLLFTSKTEGLGTSILDAFAGELPVVATKAGGIIEIIEHKVTGLLSETGNAKGLAEMVELMLKDDDLRKEIVANAKDRVKDFDFKNTATKILEIYKVVLNTTANSN
jgi:L-malate glycosyltransferase